MMLTKVEGPDSNGNKVYTFGSQHSVQTPEYYDVREIVGRGAYGIVCSAVNLTTGDAVAIKKVSRLFEDAVDAKRLLREIKLLAFLNHPNILSLKDLFRPLNTCTFSDLYIVTDLMETDMQALLRSPRIRLKAGHCQYFTLQLLCALQYMHSAHVIHRDLKPGNLLTDGECNLKLCDFGLARGIGTNMTHYVVTRWYRPPELLLVCDTYNYEVDLWAAGCLAVEMITGKPLFTGRDYINQLNLIIEYCGTPNEQNDLPENISDEALEYIRSLSHKPRKTLVEIVPELRTRFNDLDFFDSFDNDGDEPNANNDNEIDYVNYNNNEIKREGRVDDSTVIASLNTPIDNTNSRNSHHNNNNNNRVTEQKDYNGISVRVKQNDYTHDANITADADFERKNITQTSVITSERHHTTSPTNTPDTVTINHASNNNKCKEIEICSKNNRVYWDTVNKNETGHTKINNSCTESYSNVNDDKNINKDNMTNETITSTKIDYRLANSNTVECDTNENELVNESCENIDNFVDPNHSSSRSDLITTLIENDKKIGVYNKNNSNSNNNNNNKNNSIDIEPDDINTQSDFTVSEQTNVKRVKTTSTEYFAFFEDFVSKLLTFNPAKRITAKEAITHPWLADVRGGELEISGCEADNVFSWDGDDKELTIDELRHLFVQEIENFRRKREPNNEHLRMSL